MCEIKVTLLEGTDVRKHIEDVTSLEFSGDSVTVHSFFEKPMKLDGVVVQKVDCLHNVVVLRRTERGAEARDTVCEHQRN